MKTRAGSALNQALALIRAPRGARPGPDELLPDDMLLLLRIVAGEEQALSIAQEGTRESPDRLREAASFYIQQVMFASDSSSYRVLGVDADASDERMREHFRWLARWLHPDRNPDKWEAVYAERVNRAWQDLRTPERRLRYDEKRNESASPFEAEPQAPISVVRHSAYREAPSTRVDLRWLPMAIFSGLGVTALLVVSLFYVLRWAEPEPQSTPETAPAALADVALAPTTPVGAESRDQVVPTAAIVEEVQDTRTDSASATSDLGVSTDAVQPTLATNLALPGTNYPPVAPPVAPPNSVAPTVVETPATVKPTSTGLLAAKKTARESRAVVDAQTSGSSASAADRRRSASTPIARPEPRVESAARTQAPAAISQVPRPAMPLRVDATSVAAPATTPISERDANRLLGYFSQAYADGDLTGMRAMFTADVRGPRGGLDTIIAEYDKLFSGSQERSLAVRDVSWFANGATITIIASYQATVTTSRGRRARKTHGDLRLDLRREDEQWRIYRLQHDERPG